MRKTFILLVLIPFLVFAQQGKEIVTVKDSDITAASGTVTWTNDKVYMLDGYVYVEAPAELHIEAGTVIKAKETPTTGDIASVLVITRGAKIKAEGTKDAPIIFTSEYDDTDLADNGADPGVDYTIDRGLWGGVVILGNANLNVAPEKIVEGLPADEERAKYGGNDDNDSSGVFRYVSLRYTGITVEANKELQGLTLGTVGSRTMVEYVESFNSSDDGFEFFGGTVNTKYLISAFAEDDAFDYDQGFRGNHQFWFAIQGDSSGDHLGEFDGGDAGALTAEPLSNPKIFNATFIGRGAGASGGDIALMYKEYAGGEFSNSIIIDFDKAGIKVDSGDGLTSYNRFLTGGLVLQNNIWWKGAGNAVTDISGQIFMQGYLGNPANGNMITDPGLNNISRNSSGTLDPRPAAGGAAYTAARKAYPDASFENVNYTGAFGAELWIEGWTAISDIGLVPTSVKEITGVPVPAEYGLAQNYPNPFNPETKIQFTLPEAGKVRLAVYSVLGEEVMMLMNGYKNAGQYEYSFNGAGLPSGMYIYRLEAGSKVLVNKMTLLK